MLRRFLWVSSFTFFFLVGIAAHISWIAPIGHIHPQKNRFENNNININTAIRKNGNTPSAMEKKIYSNIPAPLERGFLGEFKMGSAFIIPSKLNRLIGKMASIIM
ncbi:hypothetical protein ES708_03659 [subsurface metagenome]